MFTLEESALLARLLRVLWWTSLAAAAMAAIVALWYAGPFLRHLTSPSQWAAHTRWLHAPRLSLAWRARWSQRPARPASPTFSSLFSS